MAEKKVESTPAKKAEAKPVEPETPETADPLAGYPTDVEGGKWVHDETTGDVHFERDDEKKS